MVVEKVVPYSYSLFIHSFIQSIFHSFITAFVQRLFKGATQRRPQPQHDQIKPPLVEKGMPEKLVLGSERIDKGRSFPMERPAAAKARFCTFLVLWKSDLSFS